MSTNNGIIRIGHKGIKQFAFGEDGKPFEVDVVVVFQRWLNIHKSFQNDQGEIDDMAAYQNAAREFVKEESKYDATASEALEFLARLREQWDELVYFFQPKKRAKEESPATSGVDLEFSEEPAAPSPSSMN